jgi:hypothetical protein
MFWGFGALLLLMTGCSAPAATPKPGGGDDVILLADWWPELPTMATQADIHTPPDFVLYGNGRAIVREEHDADGLTLVEYRLTPRRVERLFEEAAAAGLFDEVDYSRDRLVLDRDTQLIMLRTAARTYTVDSLVPGSEDHGPRGKAFAFAESLQPSRWPHDDFSAPPTPYRPGRVAVTYWTTTATADSNDAPRAWPLPTGEPIQSGCVVLTGAAATQAQELAETAPRKTLWQHGDATFQAWVEPLFPDEADCLATDRAPRDRMASS